MPVLCLLCISRSCWSDASASEQSESKLHAVGSVLYASSFARHLLKSLFTVDYFCFCPCGQSCMHVTRDPTIPVAMRVVS